MIRYDLSLAGGVETTVRDAYNREHSIVVSDAGLVRAVADQGWGGVTHEEVAKVTLVFSLSVRASL